MLNKTWRIVTHKNYAWKSIDYFNNYYDSSPEIEQVKNFKKFILSLNNLSGITLKTSCHLSLFDNQVLNAYSIAHTIELLPDIFLKKSLHKLNIG